MSDLNNPINKKNLKNIFVIEFKIRSKQTRQREVRTIKIGLV